LIKRRYNTTTCKQLGGACDKVFQADTFEEIAELSKRQEFDSLSQD